MINHDDKEFRNLLLEALYFVAQQSDGILGTLCTEWLDQVLLVCESAATWVLTARTDKDGDCEAEAWEYWTGRAGEDDSSGWEQVIEVTEALFANNRPKQSWRSG